ncbi:MAG: hypothetical protein HY275_11695 [Gemmatimonadetes bacterium]|nr:hypothetical protein [Gemmatimonadota bacterium]
MTRRRLRGAPPGLALIVALAMVPDVQAQVPIDVDLADSARQALAVGTVFRAWPSIGGGAQGVAAMARGQFSAGLMRLRAEGAIAARDQVNSGGAGTGLLDGRVTVDVQPMRLGPLRVDAALGIERDAYDPGFTWTQQGAQLRGWLSGERGGLWAGIGVRAPLAPASTPPANELRAGTWWRVGSVTLSAAISTVATQNVVRITTDSSQVTPGSCTVEYDATRATRQYQTTCLSQFRTADATVAAAWAVGPVALRFHVGTRLEARTPFGPGVPVWGGGTAVVPMNERTALLVDAGRRPLDVVRGTPAYTRVMAGLVVRLAGTPTVTRSELPREPSAVGTAMELGACAPDGTRPIRLRVPDATVVAELRGDFSGWRAVRLDPIGGGWAVTHVRLSPGIHHLMVRIGDGPWQPPAGLPVADDGFGGAVGVLVVPTTARDGCAPDTGAAPR